MQSSIGINQIAGRVKAIGMPKNRLARAAGLNPATLHRLNKDPRSSTVTRLSEVIVAEERRLLAHLVGLYPQEAMEAATVALCPDKARDAA